MAEVAAGAGAVLAAEEVISRGVEVGVAGYLIAKPTMPLKATFSMIANAFDDSTRRSLARSNHTLTVLGNNAYIFGGVTAQGIAINDVHAVKLSPSGKPEPDYRLIPALPEEEDGKVPDARSEHTACAYKNGILVYGGCDQTRNLVDDGSLVWLFDPERAAWKSLSGANSTSTPGPRVNSQLFADGEDLILFGGSNKSSSNLSDVWRFKVDSGTWIELPSAPVTTTNAAFSNRILYLVSGSDPTSSQLHYMELSSPSDERTWETFTFPTNPIIPGPRPRDQGGFLPVSTGYGRNYLVYFLGARKHISDSIEKSDDNGNTVEQWSDMWTLQIPSSPLEPKATLSLSNAIKPAKIKDAIRSAIGTDSGKHRWAEVEVQPPSDLPIPEGKLHPGPRVSFGCDVMEDGKGIVFWGGENAKGELVGDGWIVRFE